MTVARDRLREEHCRSAAVDSLAENHAGRRGALMFGSASYSNGGGWARRRLAQWVKS